jgi:hypothetical protein
MSNFSISLCFLLQQWDMCSMERIQQLPLVPRGSISTVQRCQLRYAASSNLPSLVWATLFVMQPRSILLWFWSMQFGDGGIGFFFCWSLSNGMKGHLNVYFYGTNGFNITASHFKTLFQIRSIGQCLMSTRVSIIVILAMGKEYVPVELGPWRPSVRTADLFIIIHIVQVYLHLSE